MTEAGAADSTPAGAADEAALRAGMAVLGLPADAERMGGMLCYLGMLERWNATYNLTAIRGPAEMVTHHLLDCLAALAAIRRSPCAPRVHRVLDVGSGGGLPGLLFALFEPGWSVTCVDAVAKKAAFIRQAAGALALPNLRPLHARVESLREAPFDLVTARAFAGLGELARMTRPLLAAEGCWMAMKARVPEAEVAALPADVEVFHVEPLTVPGLAAERCLVWMRPRRGA